MLFQEKNRSEQLQLLNDLVDSQQTPIEMVTYMNNIFATTKITSTDDLNKSRTPEEEQLVVSQLDNIFDELEELEEAIRDNDLHEVKDAIADIFTFAVGGLYITSTEPKYNEAIESVQQVKFDDMGKQVLLLNTKGLMDEYKKGTLGFVDALDFAEKWAKALDFSLHEVMANVTKANYGKLIFSLDELEKTLENYERKGVEVYVRFFSNELDDTCMKYAVVYSLLDQKDINGKQYRKNKFLKSIEFVAP